MVTSQFKMAVVFLLVVVTCLFASPTTGASSGGTNYTGIQQRLNELQHEVSNISSDLSWFQRLTLREMNSLAASFYNRSRELDWQIILLYRNGRDAHRNDSHLVFRELRGIRRKIDTDVANLQSQIDRVAHPDVMTSCGGRVSSHTRVIRYPNNGNYSNRENCTWIIQRAQPFALRFSRFDLEGKWAGHCRSDYVRFGNSRKLCGNVIPQTTHSNRDGSLTLLFHSDGSITKTGFELEIVSRSWTTRAPRPHSKPHSKPHTTPRGTHNRTDIYAHVLKKLNQLQRQVDHLTKEYNKMASDITVISRHILRRMHSLSTAFSNRSRELESGIRRLDQHLSHTRHRDRQMVIRELAHIRRKIDSDVSNLQRQINHIVHGPRTTSRPPRPRPTRPRPSSRPRHPTTKPIPIPRIPNCGGFYNATDKPGNITSPGFPSSYPSRQYCLYTIRSPIGSRVNLTFLSFKVEESGCKYDNVSIYGGGKRIAILCGNMTQPQTYYSPGRTMVVKFETDGSIQRDGFIAKFQVKDCGGFYNATDKPGNITSPGFPSSYPPRQYCLYTIRSPIGSRVKLTFLSFNVEESRCKYDKVSIYGGGKRIAILCGNMTQPQTYYSPGRSMVVKFETDGSIQRDGFIAQFEAQGRQHNTTQDWIYYPRGTRQHRIKKSYPQYNATYEGFGYLYYYADYVWYRVHTFEHCIQACAKVRQRRGVLWNAIRYEWGRQECNCQREGNEFHTSNKILTYRFYNQTTVV